MGNTGDPTRQKALLRRYLPIGLLLLAGIGLSFLLFARARRGEASSENAAFALLAQNRVVVLRTHVAEHLELLGFLADFYAVSEQVRPEDFAAFAEQIRAARPQTLTRFSRLTRPVLDRHPDARVIAWVSRVPGGEREEYEARARSLRGPGFGISDRDAAGRPVRAPERGEHLPIDEVSGPNRNLLGFDLASHPGLLDAVRRASATGSPAATPPLRLAFSGQGPGYALVLPAFAGNGGGAREAVGFVLAVFNVPEMVRLSIPDPAAEGLALSLADPAAPPGERQLYPAGSGPSAAAERGRGGGPSWSTQFDVSGRTWSLAARPTRAFRGGQPAWPSWVVLAAGGLLTLLVCAYVDAVLRHSAQAERLVAARTQELTHEVAERRKTEEALRRQTTLLESVLDSMGEGLVVCDTAGKFLIFNRAAERIIGIGPTAEGMEQWPAAFGVFLPDAVTPFPAEELPLVRAARGEETTEVEQFLRNPAVPQGVYVSVSGRPLRDADGALLGGIVLVRDVTTRRKIEAELRIAKEAAEEASREKSGFLARMSHELRTPMNGVLGMLDLALRTDLTARQRELVGTARSSAQTLLRLLNDLLDFSRLEAERLELESVPFELRETVGDVMKSLASLGHEKGLELAHYVAPDVPDTWLGDPGRLSQVLVNLVGNAIKFTSRGEVVVRVEREAADGGGPSMTLRFSVADTGIGIPPEKLRSIFAAFAQADTSTTRRFGGTGLGLAIAARLVEMMGGRIWVESAVDQGSTFHFTVSLARHEGHEEALPPPARLPDVQGLSVLVVDDHAVNRRILGELLASWGLRPVMAASGGEGLAELRRAAQAGEPYPLVVLDHMMPVMDGLMVAERIRQSAELSGAIILMLSSADDRGAAERGNELGIAVCLVKPIKESELLEAILKALGAVGAPAEAPAPVPVERTSRPLRVLVAEDNRVNQRVVEFVLEQRGHTPVLTGNGREAVAALEREAFDVVLMDVQMPEMDGFEATAAIRAREASAGGHIPILAMTAHALQGDRERCLEAGMDGYLAKPIRADELIELVESSAPAERRPEPDGLAAAGIAGNDALSKELASLFIADAARLQAEIRDAIARRDGGALQQAAHRLRGSAGYFTADRTLELARRLEQLGRDGDFSPLTDRVCEDLAEELARVEQALSPKPEPSA
ncbi:MAG TPA: response regulator [Thermoanaerobaculia bacterium]